MTRRLLLAAIATGAIVAAGCCKHTKCCAKTANSAPRSCAPAPASSTYLLPPAGVPTTPPPGSAGPLIPSVGPSNYPPPSFDPLVPAPRPSAKPAPEILLPDAIPSGTSSRSLFPPNPGSATLGAPVKAQTGEPPVVAKANAVTGLPGFVKVKDGIASGRKPTLDGFDALKRGGYRTIVYLHPAGADLSAIRELTESRNMALVAVETTPEKLTDAVDQVNRVVADKASLPAYVFDDDGIRAGTVWHVHFRTVDALNDDVARIRAKSLGLTDDGDDAKAFAVAAQRYLESR